MLFGDASRSAAATCPDLTASAIIDRAFDCNGGRCPVRSVILVSVLRTFALTTIALLGIVRPRTLDAQGVQASRVVELDNDYFEFAKDPERRSDDNYSHGLRIGFSQPVGATRASRAACRRASVCGITVSLGHQLYSPTVEDTAAIPGQRPHAGWLYTDVAVSALLTSNRRFTYGVTIGTVGPNARADDLQRWLHAQIDGFREPVGWDQQLSNEIAFAARAEVQRMLLIGNRRRWSAEVIPSVRVMAGTLRTAGAAATTVRAGWGIRNPWMREPASELSLYAMLGGSGELLDRSLFLDGNTYRASHSVASHSALRSWERGFGMRMLKLSFEYVVVSTSREYRDGPAVHTYGRIAVLWQP